MIPWPRESPHQQSLGLFYNILSRKFINTSDLSLRKQLTSPLKLSLLNIRFGYLPSNILRAQVPPRELRHRRPRGNLLDGIFSSDRRSLIRRTEEPVASLTLLAVTALL